jgi:hypothetical protein
MFLVAAVLLFWLTLVVLCVVKRAHLALLTLLLGPLLAVCVTVMLAMDGTPFPGAEMAWAMASLGMFVSLFLGGPLLLARIWRRSQRIDQQPPVPARVVAEQSQRPYQERLASFLQCDEQALGEGEVPFHSRMRFWCRVPLVRWRGPKPGWLIRRFLERIRAAGK